MRSLSVRLSLLRVSGSSSHTSFCFSGGIFLLLFIVVQGGFPFSVFSSFGSPHYGEVILIVKGSLRLLFFTILFLPSFVIIPGHGRF